MDESVENKHKPVSNMEGFMRVAQEILDDHLFDRRVDAIEYVTTRLEALCERSRELRKGDEL